MLWCSALLFSACQSPVDFSLFFFVFFLFLQILPSSDVNSLENWRLCNANKRRDRLLATTVRNRQQKNRSGCTCGILLSVKEPVVITLFYRKGFYLPRRFRYSLHTYIQQAAYFPPTGSEKKDFFNPSREKLIYIPALRGLLSLNMSFCYKASVFLFSPALIHCQYKPLRRRKKTNC